MNVCFCVVHITVSDFLKIPAVLCFSRIAPLPTLLTPSSFCLSITPSCPINRQDMSPSPFLSSWCLFAFILSCCDCCCGLCDRSALVCFSSCFFCPLHLPPPLLIHLFPLCRSSHRLPFPGNQQQHKFKSIYRSTSVRDFSLKLRRSSEWQNLTNWKKKKKCNWFRYGLITVRVNPQEVIP